MDIFKCLGGILAIFSCLSESSSIHTLPKIAIIGGGVGGTSTAYFLRDLFGSEVSIDLYESNKIGGRLATVAINDIKYETGGSILHPRNKYMVDFLKLLGQKKREDTVFSKFGIYDGTGFVYKESNYEFLSLIKLVWRYGFGSIKLQNFIDDMLTKFSRIYTLQDHGQCYVTVKELLQAMSPTFVDSLTTSTKKGFMRSGFSEKIIDELIMATLTANYGQSTDVHEFVGLVSVAGASGGLWAVENGNNRIAEELLRHSGATHVSERVLKVSFNPGREDYTLEFSNNGTDIYDIVIIATPLTSDVSDIEIIHASKRFSFLGEFHQTVCTIVKGKVNHTYFGFEEESEMIDEILFLNFNSFFHSIGRINSVEGGKQNGKSNVWKLFSKNPIQENDLKKVFTEIDNVDVVNWKAYPHYNYMPRNDSFILDQNLYYVNAIEWAASAMEMSIIGAKNVALLAYKTWQGQDYTDSMRRFHTEL